MVHNLNTYESMELNKSLLLDSVILDEEGIRVENNVALRPEITEVDTEEGQVTVVGE